MSQQKYQMYAARLRLAKMVEATLHRLRQCEDRQRRTDAAITQSTILNAISRSALRAT